jgi:hypothetical protein
MIFHHLMPTGGVTMATARQLEHTKTDIYEHDFLAWTEEQAQALREKQAGRLDWGNLLEEIESMGASQKQEIRNRLRVCNTSPSARI